jgi:hypothetical protein
MNQDIFREKVEVGPSARVKVPQAQRNLDEPRSKKWLTSRRGNDRFKDPTVKVAAVSVVKGGD